MSDKKMEQHFTESETWYQ